MQYAVLSSLPDNTPEGKFVVALGERLSGKHQDMPSGTVFMEFTAQTRMSGVDLPDGTKIRKGAYDAILKHVQALGGPVTGDLEATVQEVSKLGGTPLVVCVNERILGVIYLKDTIKDGLVERFARLRAIGIKTVMCTGDNPLTAATIAQEAGVDGFIAECKPEDKHRSHQGRAGKGQDRGHDRRWHQRCPGAGTGQRGIAMNSGTTAAKEAANMVDLDSDPTKILDVVEIGKLLLITRGALTTFSIANDIAKYFAILPAMFMTAIPQMSMLNIMALPTPSSAVLAALIFNAVIIPCLIPLAMKGVKYTPQRSEKMLRHNMLLYGLGGMPHRLQALN